MSLDNLSLSTVCANCGKGEEESTSLKPCVACKVVKYCSRDCQKAHRSQHKQECSLRAAELHDEALFKQPPPREDCPICFLRLPSLGAGRRYNSCCGKIICSGCLYAGAKMAGNADELCPFCRAPAPASREEAFEWIKKRKGVGDAVAIYELGCCYYEGTDLPQDRDKALELWHRAGELGHTAAYNYIGCAYEHDEVVVERDEKKAIHYYELAAIGGGVFARHNLGCGDGNDGNMDRALKHFMIAVGFGDGDSLKMIQRMYKDGHATRDDYAKALKAYQAYLGEIKSDDRDKAAAYSDNYKYYG